MVCGDPPDKRNHWKRTHRFTEADDEKETSVFPQPRRLAPGHSLAACQPDDGLLGEIQPR